MNILVFDIETSPIEARVWSLREQRIGLNQITKPSRVISMAYALHHLPVRFLAEWKGGHESMIRTAHHLLDNADAVVHYNGRRFDVPHLNREFVEIGLNPPSPFKQIDLWRVVSSKFNFPSNKLEYVASELLEHEKIRTDMGLWNRVIAGDKTAQAEMEKYNLRDVELTDELYTLLLPWIDRHPNVGLYVPSDAPTCTACSSTNVQKRGYAYTNAGKFQRYACGDCGRWLRGASRIETTPLREAL